MRLHFSENDTFRYNGEEWEIVNIDYEDDEYPYECYPIKVIQDAKKIAVDDDCDYFDVLVDTLIDERICFSEYDIMTLEHNAVVQSLKEEIRKLKGEN